MKKILVIDAHPDSESFCAALSQAYFEGAEHTGFQLERLNLRDLYFDPILHEGCFHRIQELEPDLLKAQKLIKWADHVVLVYPLWWGSVPALLKAFFDRALLPSFAFKYHDNNPFWDRLLKGRSARMIVTSDAPRLYNLLAYWDAPYKVVKKAVLSFCGFKPVRLTAFGSIKNTKKHQRNKMIEKVRKLGSYGI